MTTMLACRTTGYQPNEQGVCSYCRTTTCLVDFVRVESLLGMEQWRAWFLCDPGGEERQVSREDYVAAERRAGFHPKPGLGPEATGSFGASSGQSGRTATTWPGRVYER